jgi:hypothetical protein
MTPRERMYKMATNYIEMGKPDRAGKGIADIVKFLTQRIPPEARVASMLNLKNQILHLDELEISHKKTPPTATLGQSITFIKTILIGHNPKYIRDVITSICRNLI